MASANEVAGWRRTRRLIVFVLAIGAGVGFGIPHFLDDLDAIVWLGFPVGYLAAAQGVPVLFVILAFLFAARQHDIECRHGVAEDA